MVTPSGAELKEPVCQNTNVVKLSINLGLVGDLIAAIMLLHKQVICCFFVLGWVFFFFWSVLWLLTFFIKAAQSWIKKHILFVQE